MIHRTVVILHPLQPVYDRIQDRLRPLAADAARELDVLAHDGDALGVDSAEVGVFEEADEIGFSSFLEGEDCRALPSQVLEVLRDLFDKTLERALPDEELRSPLQLPDLTEGDGTWAVAMRFLVKHTSV